MLTVSQAAQRLGMKPETLYLWIAQRRLTHCKLGRSIRIPEAEITRLIERATIPARQKRD
jgi:excisionase family DNA binding protein